MAAVGIPTTGKVPSTETRQARWGGLGGLLFTVLLTGAVTMTGGMPQAKDPAKVQAWAVRHTGLLTGAFVVNSIGVVVGLCFLIWLHSQLTRDGASWMGNLFLVGVTIFAVSGTVAAGINAVMGTDAKHLSTGSLQLMASFSQNFNYPVTVIGLTAMYLAAGFLIRRTGLLPAWLAWVSWVFALTGATVFLGVVSVFGTVLWLIAVSVILIAGRSARG